MRILYDAILQKNRTYLVENLQVDLVLDALYQKCIFTQADCDRCRKTAPESRCESFLEILKRKGVEGYIAFSTALSVSQPFIKDRLDATVTEEGYEDLVSLTLDIMEDQHKKDLLEKDGEIADLRFSVQRLEAQVRQNSLDQDELEETIKKEREEHRSQMEKQKEEADALKKQLSRLDLDLQESQANCEKIQKQLHEEQESYDALVGAPRSQPPDTVDVTEHIEQAGSEERICQFSSQSCCDESQLRLLPCLHSACKPCLDHQATQAEDTCKHCPSCGHEFTMEQTTVDHVRCNQAAYKVNADGEMKCSYIDEDHDAKAVMYCPQCDDKLCPDCHKLHDSIRGNRNHRVNEINQAKNIPMIQWLKERRCRDHSDYKLQLYDHTCKKTICLMCTHGAHKDHQNEDLYQAYDVAKGQLEEQVKRLQDKLKDVTDRMKTVKSHQTELGSTQRRLEQVATTACKGVAAKFLHRQRQLMEEIQVSLQSPYKMVQDKLDTLHNFHTSVASAIDYTQRTLESTRREELITLTDVLLTKNDDIRKMKLPEDDTQDTRILLTFQGQRALEKLINTFGGLASSLSMDHIPDSQPTLQDLLKMILRERQTNERLEDQVQQNSLNQAELKETNKKEREEHRSQMEKQKEEAEALNMQLSKLDMDLQHSRAECQKIQKRLEDQVQQNSLNQAELKETNKKEREEHRSQMEKQKEEAEALKKQLSKLDKDLQHSRAECQKIQKMHEEQCQQLQQTMHDIPDGATLHIIKGDHSVNIIICPKLQLDGDVANTDYCHVTPGGELVNSPPATQHTDRGRLQTLCGTCSSTPIPLPPSPSSVNPVSPTTRYWEAHTRVGVLGGELGWPVLEVGVGEESQVDSKRCVCDQRRSWCVCVERCLTHRGSLCTRVYMAGERGKCYSNPMSNTPGTQAILHYGVVLDVGRGRIGFIDIDRSVVLGKVDVEFRENLLPVFAVCPFSFDYTVNMKVVSGEEILMSDIKKSLINEVLA